MSAIDDSRSSGVAQGTIHSDVSIATTTSQGSLYNCSSSSSSSSSSSNSESPRNQASSNFISNGTPTLDQRIALHHSETKVQAEFIHEQLKNEIQTFNVEATMVYNSLNKAANDEVAALQRQIEEVLRHTNLRQREIYEETCRKTTRAQEDAYQRIHLLSRQRAHEVQMMIFEDASRNNAAVEAVSTSGEKGSDVARRGGGNDLRQGSVSGNMAMHSSFSSTAFDSDEWKRKFLVARGMAVYTVSHDEGSGTTSVPAFMYPPSAQTPMPIMSAESSRYCSLSSSSNPSVCQFEGCTKRPSCNVTGESSGIFCGAHKLPDMVNVMYKRCEVPDCSRMPGFNFEGQLDRRFCSVHKSEGMVNVAGTSSASSSHYSVNMSGRSVTTEFNRNSTDVGVADDNTENRKRAVGGQTSQNTQKKPRRRLKTNGGRCEAEGCNKHPSFNTKGLVGGRFCSAHKMEGMIDVISKRCELCSKQAAFNFEGQTRGRFCSGHKEPGMINVKDKLCEVEGCSKYPTANFEGLSGRRFCTTHKLDGMINFTNKRCEAAGCVKHPKYNFAGKSGRRFCVDHKEDGMVATS